MNISLYTYKGPPSMNGPTMNWKWHQPEGIEWVSTHTNLTRYEKIDKEFKKRKNPLDIGAIIKGHWESGEGIRAITKMVLITKGWSFQHLGFRRGIFPIKRDIILHGKREFNKEDDLGKKPLFW